MKKKTFTYLMLALLFFGCQHKKSFYSIVDLPDTTQESICQVSTKRPLNPYPLLQLPLGSIQATGWLETQLDLMTEGYTGHLYEIR